VKGLIEYVHELEGVGRHQGEEVIDLVDVFVHVFDDVFGGLPELFRRRILSLKTLYRESLEPFRLDPLHEDGDGFTGDRADHREDLTILYNHFTSVKQVHF
jgi:hypothetical protein